MANTAKRKAGKAKAIGGLERARLEELQVLKRAHRQERQIATLSTQLRRAVDRREDAMLELARHCARAVGMVLADEAPATGAEG